MVNRFVDITKVTANLTGTCTFTNGSTTVTGSGTHFTTELAVGNYIRVSTGVEWYKVTAITNDVTLTISPAFQQATITDSPNSTKKNAEDGTTPDRAFCHINQATTDEVRAPGDKIFLRRGQSHLYAGIGISFDEDGTPNNYITLMGDDGTGWPGETGLARPVVSFGNTGNEFTLYFDDFWRLKDFEVTGATGTRVVNFGNCGGKLESIVFRDNGAGRVLDLDDARSVLIKDCSFYGNGNVLYCLRTRIRLDNCSIYGNTGTALSGDKSVVVVMKDTTFGVPTANNTDISFGGLMFIRGRNITLDPAKVSNISAIAREGSYLKIEDFGGTKLDNRAWFYMGKISRDTTLVRPGGASSSAKMEPNDKTGVEWPLELCMFTEELSRWLAAGPHSCKMYVYGENWTTLPTADELYLEVLYFDGATTKRASVRSTQALSSNLTWTELSVTFNLNSDSPVYANVLLKKYQANARIYVDILPVWS